MRFVSFRALSVPFESPEKNKIENPFNAIVCQNNWHSQVNIVETEHYPLCFIQSLMDC